MATIKAVEARLIYDSRGKPTHEVYITLSDGTRTRDATTCIGTYEADETINKIIGPALIGKDPTDQAFLDNLMLQKLDEVEMELGVCKKKLEAEAISAVSRAICKAGASVLNIPRCQYIANLAGVKNLAMPVPAFIVINGGSLAGNKFPIKELMIIPVGASSFKEATKMGFKVYHNLKSVIKKKYGQDAMNLGDEGGFAPDIQGYEEGLELVTAAIAKAEYIGKVVIGMNVAASEFYGEDKTYNLNYKEEILGVPLKKRISGFFTDLYMPYTPCNEKISAEQLKDLYKPFVNKHPIVSIEGPFAQFDLEQYAKMTAECGERLQIVGDDRLIFDSMSLNKAIKEKICNALLLKVHQFGSVTEIIKAVKMSKHAGWGVIAGHCSGESETEDTFVADLSVGLAMSQIKTGAPGRSANYNQLLVIEEELGTKAVYGGANFCKPIGPYNDCEEGFLR